jgi:hypothetical protein
MTDRYEYWYDPKHTGALRIIDKTKKIIYGSDPGEKKWIALIEYVSENEMIVDFGPKKTHRNNKIFNAKYTNRRQNIQWRARGKTELDNTWLRIRVPLENVLSQIN